MQVPPIMSRVGLGILPPREGMSLLRLPVDTLFIHHTDTAGVRPSQEWRAVQGYHMNREKDPMHDIAYHRGFPGGYMVYEGRELGWQSGATLDENDHSISFCAIGNYDLNHPSEDMILAMVSEALWLVETGFLQADARVLGHRESHKHPGRTECPGKNLLAVIPRIRELFYGGGPTDHNDYEEEGEGVATYLVKHQDNPEGFLVDGGTTTWLSYEEWVAYGGEAHHPTNPQAATIQPGLPVIITGDNNRYSRLKAAAS